MAHAFDHAWGSACRRIGDLDSPAIGSLVSAQITAIHTLVYSDDATATRAFFKDVLQWPFVSDRPPADDGTRTHTGTTDPAEWLIFATGRSELGVHPTSGEYDSSPMRHEISVMCDDLTATMAELSGRGAEFGGEPQEMGFGRGVSLRVPAADDMLLYQPHHATAYDLEA